MLQLPLQATPHRSFPSTVFQYFVSVGLGVASLSMGHSAVALTPSAEPFSVNQMKAGMCSANVQGTPYDSISQTAMRTPSLWWVKDEISAKPQYGRKLIDRWIACTNPQGQPDRVDFLVNQQLWSLLDYLERYELISRLGNAASQQQYNLRVFNVQGDLLAAYTCNFGAAVATKSLEPKQEPNLTCNLSLNSGDRGFRSNPNSDGPFPTTGGTLLR